MLNRLPPRLHMFVRGIMMLGMAVLAGYGFIALYRGLLEAPHWSLLVGLLMGTVFASIFRDVPPDILQSQRRSRP